MKSIVSKEEQNKKQRRNQLVVGIILIALMFLSVGGYAFYGRGDETGGVKKIKYNGYELNLQNNYFILELGEYSFGFRNSPYSTEAEIETNLNLLNSYSDKPLYIFSENSEATYEISLNLQQVSQRMQRACLENSSCIEEFPELPIKDCTENFIIIREGNSSKITQDKNCVYIEFKQDEFLNVTDEFLYNIIGVK